MDEETTIEVAEKSRHGVNSSRPCLLHHYLSNRRRCMSGHTRFGRRHGCFKGAASGQGHIDHQEPGRAFRHTNAGISVSGNDDQSGVHSQILKQRSVHDRSVNTICAALVQAYSGHADALTHAFVVAQRKRTLDVGESRTLQSNEDGLSLPVSSLFLLAHILPILITW